MVCEGAPVCFSSYTAPKGTSTDNYVVHINHILHCDYTYYKLH